MRKNKWIIAAALFLIAIFLLLGVGLESWKQSVAPEHKGTTTQQ